MEPKLTDEQAAKAAQREKLVVMLLSNGYLMPQNKSDTRRRMLSYRKADRSIDRGVWKDEQMNPAIGTIQILDIWDIVGRKPTTQWWGVVT